jgi:predicted acetyltransferase
MNIEIKEAPVEDKSVIRNLLELYIYDLTEFGPYDVDSHGLYGYKHLDYYWIEEGRYPFIVYVDNKIAGFVLIRRDSLDNINEYTYSIAEFFIMKRYRVQGVGKKVAFHIFNHFKGVWEVAEMKSNIPAQNFWRRVINEFTHGDYEEISKSNWNGPIQRFTS